MVCVAVSFMVKSNGPEEDRCVERSSTRSTDCEAKKKTKRQVKIPVDRITTDDSPEKESKKRKLTDAPKPPGNAYKSSIKGKQQCFFFSCCSS